MFYKKGDTLNHQNSNKRTSESPPGRTTLKRYASLIIFLRYVSFYSLMFVMISLAISVLRIINIGFEKRATVYIIINLVAAIFLLVLRRKISTLSKSL